MCALKQSSILRTVDPAILQSFLWQAFCVEAKKITLYTILDQLLEVREFPSQVKRRTTGKAHRVDKFPILGFSISLLCCYQNQSMNPHNIYHLSYHIYLPSIVHHT